MLLTWRIRHSCEWRTRSGRAPARTIPATPRGSAGRPRPPGPTPKRHHGPSGDAMIPLKAPCGYLNGYGSKARHCGLPTDFSSGTSLSLEKPMIRARILHVLACSASLIAAECAHGQTATPPVRPDAGNPVAPGPAFPADAAAYCPDLKRLAALAATKDRFAGIAGRPRDGNFVETTLPLAGW